MFTGIIQEVGKVQSINNKKGRACLTLETAPEVLEGIAQGASVSVNGVCLTVVRFERGTVTFDLLDETLNRTNLRFLENGAQVNIERATKFGEEIGGHVLSGHIFGTAKLEQIEGERFFFSIPHDWSKYFIEKGYIALDGISLTLVDVSTPGSFCVHVIPETLRVTTLGVKSPGDLVNVEFESTTKTVVDTIYRMLQK